jgi:RNA polymerase sigma factor (sigma-70 family)
MFELFVNIKKLSDEELFGRYLQTGSSRMAEELFKRYFHIVLGVAYKYLQDKDEAKDVVMLVFEKFMVDSKVQVVQNFGGWIYSTTKNTCLNRLKAKERQQSKEEAFGKEWIDLLEEEEELDPMLELLPKAMESLGAEQRKCVQLFYLEKKSYKEIAQVTGFSELQVKSYIQNGKRNLKNYLESSTNQAS